MIDPPTASLDSVYRPFSGFLDHIWSMIILLMAFHFGLLDGIIKRKIWSRCCLWKGSKTNPAPPALSVQLIVWGDWWRVSNFEATTYLLLCFEASRAVFWCSHHVLEEFVFEFRCVFPTPKIKREGKGCHFFGFANNQMACYCSLNYRYESIKSPKTKLPWQTEWNKMSLLQKVSLVLSVKKISAEWDCFFGQWRFMSVSKLLMWSRWTFQTISAMLSTEIVRAALCFLSFSQENGVNLRRFHVLSSDVMVI